MIRFLLVFFVPFSFYSQEKTGDLPPKLNEISGLVFVTDDLLVGHNDSGNSPVLYFLNTKGDIQHEVKIKNAENEDWEDIAFDGKGKIYIGDFGNNENKRQDLCIYIVSLEKALKSDDVEAEKISFKYEDQEKFPPSEKNMNFDCEGMAFYKDSLYLFTKCKTEPWDGHSRIYTVDVKKKNQEANYIGKIYIGPNGWWQDAVTAVDISNNICYVLTYNRLMKYQIVDGRLKFVYWVYLKPITQKESVAVNSKGEIFVADEKSTALGGGHIYKVDFPKDKKYKKRKSK